MFKNFFKKNEYPKLNDPVVDGLVKLAFTEELELSVQEIELTRMMLRGYILKYSSKPVELRFPNLFAYMGALEKELNGQLYLTEKYFDRIVFCSKVEFFGRGVANNLYNFTVIDDRRVSFQIECKSKKGTIIKTSLTEFVRNQKNVEGSVLDLQNDYPIEFYKRQVEKKTQELSLMPIYLEISRGEV